LYFFVFIFHISNKNSYFIDFGLKIEETQGNVKNKFLTPFDFEPFIMGFLPNTYCIDYKSSLESENEEKKEEHKFEKEKKDKKASYQKKTRNIIISDPKVSLFYYKSIYFKMKNGRLIVWTL